MSRARLAAAGCLALAAFFAWLFYVRYWKWRDCIGEALSSCITPDGANLTSGGMLWGLIALVLAAAALRLALRR
jgi:hypothetical protein